MKDTIAKIKSDFKKLCKGRTVWINYDKFIDVKIFMYWASDNECDIEILDIRGRSKIFDEITRQYKYIGSLILDNIDIGGSKIQNSKPVEEFNQEIKSFINRVSKFEKDNGYKDLDIWELHLWKME